MALVCSIPAIGFSQQTPPPDPVHTEVTVSAGLSSAPELRAAPGLNLDDRLRLVPGFSLFRRTSSLAANPTTQGVSLRGLGSTGASRTLVLWDGIPLQSPFGGWVYWTRIDPETVERVEVVRAGYVSSYRDMSMSGVVALYSKEDSAARSGSVSFDAGNASTAVVSGNGALAVRPGLSLSASARGLSTAGYFLVPEPARGPIDTRAGVDSAGGSLNALFSSSLQRLRLHFDALSEARQNGTVLTQNSTTLGTVSAHYSRAGLTLTAFHAREEYHATFSSVAAKRLTETLTGRQSVPAEGSGGSVALTHDWAGIHLSGGGDYLRTEGYSREPARTSGGSLTQFGFYGLADRQWRRWHLSGGLRAQRAAGLHYLPSGGITLKTGSILWRASAYAALRAPTLNELYRDFRAGNVLTTANALLKPETTRGAEAGLAWQGLNLTFYSNHLENLIANITVSSTASLITRQRRNSAQATARGIEASYRRGWHRWSGEASYLLADSRYSTGERIPQVAKHQGSLQLSWTRGKTLLSGGVRSASLQFEDDRNSFILPGFAVWHGAVRQGLSERLEARFELENALSHTVIAGFSPTPMVGAPRLWRLGLRWLFR